LPCTGASCFRWAVDDYVLRHGPLEFRLRTVAEAVSVKMLGELVEDMVNRWRNPYPPHSGVVEHALSSNNADIRTNGVRRGVLGSLIALDVAIACRLAPTRRSMVTLLGVAAVPALVTMSLRMYPHKRSRTIILFVYGTLKRNFHWNQKFMSLCGSFVAEAETVEQWPLVVGNCGVPYVLLQHRELNHKHNIRGELWEVNEEALIGMDDYEGVTKGYYGRVPIECRVTSSAQPPHRHVPHVVQAHMYGLVSACHLWTEEELPMLNCVPEYTLDMHEAHYRPIEHISVKQQLYLSHARRYNATDDHAAPTHMS